MQYAHITSCNILQLHPVFGSIIYIDSTKKTRENENEDTAFFS